jgi:putative membrane protein
MIKATEPLQRRAFDTAYMKSQLMNYMTAIILFQQEALNGENKELREYANKICST